MKPLFKNLFFNFLPKHSLSKSCASILMYHSIAEDDNFISISKGEFKRQMQYLVESQIPVISLKTLVNRLYEGKPLGGSVVITFDDGYADNYFSAFPILKQLNLPATIFMTTDLIGKENKNGVKYLSVIQMQEILKTNLIDFEPHSKSHPHLSRLSLEDSYSEINHSKSILEGILQKECTIFSYPYGDYTQKTINMIKKIGFIAAVTVKEGLIYPNNDPFTLSRNSIDKTTTFNQFRGKISSAIDIYQKFKLALIK